MHPDSWKQEAKTDIACCAGLAEVQTLKMQNLEYHLAFPLSFAE